jgi:hypothetical protein
MRLRKLLLPVVTGSWSFVLAVTKLELGNEESWVTGNELGKELFWLPDKTPERLILPDVGFDALSLRHPQSRGLSGVEIHPQKICQSTRELLFCLRQF